MTNLSRRRYQRGSIKDDKDRWVCRYREDVILPAGSRMCKGDKLLPTGEVLHRPMRQIYLSPDLSEKGARRELAKIISGIKTVEYRATPAGNFAAFAKKWQEDVMIHHKPSSRRSEKSVIKVHLLPAFGQYQLRDISAEILQRWVSGQERKPKTVRNIVTVFQEMWVQVKAWGYAQHDPFDGLTLPTAVAPNVYSFTPQESAAIIAASKGWKRVLFWTAAELGIRVGEVAGLRIEDVEGRIVHVRQSVWNREVQTPKTKNAVRNIPISAELAVAIEDHIKTMTGPNPHGLLFHAATGRPLSMDNFRHRTLNPLLKKLKIDTQGKRCGLLALRHMNATLMDELAVPIKARQERLGHADANTTLKNYTHAVSRDSIAASDQIGALLNPTEGTVQ